MNHHLLQGSLLLAALALGPVPAATQASPAEVKPDAVAAALERAPSDSAPAAGAEYVIGPADVLAIDVWREPEISRVEPVRPDGKITLPLIGELEASGETAPSLQAEIARRLASYIHQPAVTVIVQQANSRRFNIIGEVARPGTYPLAPQTTALDAIALAGGFREFAKTRRVYVVRRQASGVSARIPFNYKAAIHGDPRSLDLRLQTGDTVIVP